MKALHRNVHAITDKHFPLNERQLQGHAQKLISQHILPPMVLRSKEIFRTAGAIETRDRVPPRDANDFNEPSTHFPVHYACIKIGLPFSGRLEYPTVEADNGYIFTGDTVDGSVEGHTLVYTLAMPIDKFNYSAANAKIQDWLVSVEKAVALLNAKIDEFNKTVSQEVEQLLRTQCQYIGQAIEDMARLPYPIKTL